MPATFIPLDQPAPAHPLAGEPAAARVAPISQVLADQAEQQRQGTEEARLKQLLRERDEAHR